MSQITTRDYGILCRKALEKKLNETWGKLTVEGSWFKSQKNNNKLLTIYSDLREDKWFYGIKQADLINLDSNSYLAIIMRDGNYCNYVLLTPDEVIKFVSRINLSTGNQKLFNIRIPITGKIYIVQWSDFPLGSRIIDIGNIDPEEAIIEKFTKKIKKLSANELDKLIAIIKTNNSKKI